MDMGFIAVVAFDLVLLTGGFAYVWYLAEHSERGVTPMAATLLWLAVPLAQFLFVGLLTGYEQAQGLAEDGPASRLRILIMMGCGLIPLLPASILFLKHGPEAITNRLFWSQVAGPEVSAYDNARRLVREQKIDEAVAEYRRIAAEYPESPDPLLAAAGVLESFGRPGDSVAVLRELLARFPQRSIAWKRAARQLVQVAEGPLNDPDLAYQYRTLLKGGGPSGAKAPRGRRQSIDRAAGHRNKARKHINENRLDDCVDEYRKQYQTNDSTPRALFAAAAALEREGRHDAAADVLRQATADFRDQDEVWADAAYRLALLLESHLYETKAAVKLYSEIIRRVPKSNTGRLAGARLQAAINAERGAGAE